MDVVGKVTQVKCKVYNVIEEEKKLMVPELNSLQKHVDQKKSTIASKGLVVKDFYFLKTNQRVVNKKLYVHKGKDSI